MAGLSDVKHEGCSAVLVISGLASSFHHFSGEICSASGTKPNKVRHARVGPLPDVKSRAETNHRPSQPQPTRYRMSLQRDEGSPTGLHLDFTSGLGGSVARWLGGSFYHAILSNCRRGVEFGVKMSE